MYLAPIVTYVADRPGIKLFGRFMKHNLTDTESMILTFGKRVESKEKQFFDILKTEKGEQTKIIHNYNTQWFMEANDF